jgi:hypothetical protein
MVEPILCLTFKTKTQGGRFVLAEVVFRPPQFGASGIRSGLHKQFWWTGAVQALAFFLVTCKARHLRRGAAGGCACDLKLEGPRPSPAASINDLMTKWNKVKWPANIFGKAGDLPPLWDLIERENGDFLDRARPVVLHLNRQNLPPERIEVSMDGERIDDAGRLEDLARDVEEQWGEISKNHHAASMGRSPGTGGPTQLVEVRLNRHFATFTAQDEDQFRALIAAYLGIEADRVVIAFKREGSVLLGIELPPGDAERLYWAIKAGEFVEMDAVDARLARIESPAEPVRAAPRRKNQTYLLVGGAVTTTILAAVALVLLSVLPPTRVAYGIVALRMDPDELKGKNVRVIITRDGKEVESIDPRQLRGVRLPTGRYGYEVLLEVDRGELRFATGNFTLRKDSREVIDSDPKSIALAKVRELGGRVKKVPVFAVDLAGTRVTVDDLKYLLALDRLHTLDLSMNPQITDAGLDRVGKLTGLRGLYLGWTSITDSGLEHIAGLKQLRHLILRDTTKIKGDGLKHLRGLAQLDRLDLYNARITDAALEHIRAIPKLGQLVLSETDITDAGLASLRGKSFYSLDLAGTSISDEGLSHLTGSKIVKLNISGTLITDDGLSLLEGMAGLQELKVVNTRVTHEGLERLKEARPALKITSERR